MYLHWDPFYFVIGKIAFESWLIEALCRMTFEIVRLCLSTICVFGAFRLLFLVIVSFITMASMIENTFQLLSDSLIESLRFRLRVNIDWNALCYNKFIICSHMCEFNAIVSLFLMGMGMLILVMFNFITIRMHNFFPFYIWCFFPAVSVIVVGTIQILVPQCVATTELAAKFKMLLILASEKSSHRRRKTRAMSPLRINVGLPGYVLFSLSKSIKVSNYGAILCHTINLILAVP